MAAIPKGNSRGNRAAGFIGGWVIKLLLAEGYRVRACVRDVTNDERVAFLKEMPGF